jgi:hypothetical protein
LGLLAAGSVLLFATPASATAVATVGAATIAAPGATAAAVLPSGKVGTPFTVALPANAACPGDTAHSGYHVYSYLVPAGTNLAAVSFVNFPSKGYGLVDQYGKYYGAINTAEKTGQIIGIPNDFEWGPLVTSDGGRIPIASLVGGANHGVWEAGIACADTHGVLAASWNTQVTFSESAHTASGLSWRATPGMPSGAVATGARHGRSQSYPAHRSSVSATAQSTAGHQTNPGANVHRASDSGVEAHGAGAHHAGASTTSATAPAAKATGSHSQAAATHLGPTTRGATQSAAADGGTGPSGIIRFPLVATVLGALLLATFVAFGLRRKWHLGTESTAHRSAS